MNEKTVDTAGMRKAEDDASAAGISKLLMMENAGRAVAAVVSRLFDPSLKPSVLIVAGTGNNGGDGAAAARHLDGKATLTVVLLGRRESVKTEEASLQWRVLASMKGVRALEVVWKSDMRGARPFFASSSVIIDAILGTGVRGTIGEPHASAIRMINESKSLRVAVDIPSGLDPDTGEDHGLVVKADVTVTLHAAKPGTLKRSDVVGKLLVEGIGIP